MESGAFDDEHAWEVHLHPERWPERDGMRFVVAAFDDVVGCLFGLTAEDLVCDFAESGASRNAVTAILASALMSGSLIAHAQPSRGGDLRPVPPNDWVPDNVDRVVATGTFGRRLAGRSNNMWVFLDSNELALMLRVLSFTDMLHQPGEEGPLEHMGTTILSSLNAIANRGRKDSGDQAAENVLRLLLPSLTRRLDHEDQQSLARAVAVWLRGQFDLDPHRRLDRDHFARAAEHAFGDVLSTRVFDTSWRLATGWQTGTGTKPHLVRRKPGPKRNALSHAK